MLTEHVSKFNEWVDSVNGDRGSTRYAHCLYADAEPISSLLTGDEPGSRGSRISMNPRAFVKLIDVQFTREPEQLTGDDISDDEGFPPIDGCRREDVGWMKVAARILIPREYSILMDNDWPIAYLRPPKIQWN